MGRFFRNMGVNRVNQPSPSAADAIACPWPADLHENAPDQSAAQREWQAHLDAGRLAAAHAPPAPEIAANRARTDAIFARRAAWHRYLERR